MKNNIPNHHLRTMSNIPLRNDLVSTLSTNKTTNKPEKSTKLDIHQGDLKKASQRHSMMTKPQGIKTAGDIAQILQQKNYTSTSLQRRDSVDSAASTAPISTASSVSSVSSDSSVSSSFSSKSQKMSVREKSLALLAPNLSHFSVKNNKLLRETLNNTVSTTHQKALSDVSLKKKYVFSVRETGDLSIKRLKEGAKPKPHTILEKSIKDSSLKKAYGEEVAKQKMELIKEKNVDGFVGHWESGKLIGVRVDNYDSTDNRIKDVDQLFQSQNIAVEDIVKQDKQGNQVKIGSYIPINLDDPSGGFDSLDKLQQNDKWQSVLYTGDYDLHEAYSSQGGRKGQIPEGSMDKVRFMNDLNNAVANNSEDTFRSGSARLGNDGLIHNSGAYAVIQHGDQATYRTNQLLEARKDAMTNESGNNARLGENKSTIVKAVGKESDEPLAWCVKGEWYVSMNKEEHKMFRELQSINKPNTWSDDKARARIEKLM